MNIKSNITVNFFMIIFMITVLMPLQACGDGRTFSSGEVTGSENEKAKDYELGSFEIDGLEGTLEGHAISFSSSELSYNLRAIEYGEVDNIYNSEDCGFAFGIFKEDKMYINISIGVYTAFETNKIYEFSSKDFGNVTLTYYYNDGTTDSSGISNVRVVFSNIPTSVEQLTAGELEITTSKGDKMVMSFSDKMASYTLPFECSVMTN
jgi:hypothetical protein